MGNAAGGIAQAFTLIVADARVHTMFGFLLAYGPGGVVDRRAHVREGRRHYRLGVGGHEMR